MTAIAVSKVQRLAAVSEMVYEPAHCIVCGHSNADVIAERDDLRAELEELWGYSEKRLMPATPPERLKDRLVFSERLPLRLVRCRECGLVYRNPIERSQSLRAVYGNDAPPRDAMRALHEAQRSTAEAQARLLRQKLGPGTWSGLEVGSYVGAFLAAAKDNGLYFEGIDINRDVSAFARSLGFCVHDGELTSIESERRFDALTIWNTFDQLADPRGTLHAAHRLLRRGGVLALRVPNGAFYARFRRWLGPRKGVARAVARTMLAQNNLLSFPYRWGFTPGAIRRLLTEQSFRVRQIKGDVLVPTADGWTRPWARFEESVVKSLLWPIARRRGSWAPWIEVYAGRD